MAHNQDWDTKKRKNHKSFNEKRFCVLSAFLWPALWLLTYALEDEGLSEVFFAGELSLFFFSDLSAFDVAYRLGF